MRASGVPAQYVSGTLTENQARQLVGSMSPESFQTIGVIPVGQQTADPLNDAALLAEVANHSWFRFDTGGGMQDADPLMPGAQIGQSFTPATSSFAEVPDGWSNPDPVDPLHVVLVAVLLPLALALVLVALVYGPPLARGERVAPHAPEVQDQWLGGPRKAAGELAGPDGEDSQAGGASGRW